MGRYNLRHLRGHGEPAGAWPQLGPGLSLPNGPVQFVTSRRPRDLSATLPCLHRASSADSGSPGGGGCWTRGAARPRQRLACSGHSECGVRALRGTLGRSQQPLRWPTAPGSSLLRSRGVQWSQTQGPPECSSSRVAWPSFSSYWPRGPGEHSTGGERSKAETAVSRAEGPGPGPTRADRCRRPSSGPPCSEDPGIPAPGTRTGQRDHTES